MPSRFLNNININDEYTLPSADGEENQIIVTDGAGNLSFDDLSTVTGKVEGVEADIIYYEVKNSTGTTIDAFKGVMAVGTDGNSGHILVDEMVADGSVEARYFLGITREPILNGGISRVISFGEIDQINTNAFPNGTVLWCDPANPGDFTATEPNGPNLKIPAAFVLNQATNGKIQVRVQGNEGIKDLYDTKIESGRVRRSTLSAGGSGYTVANNVPTTGGSGAGLEINILTLGVGDSIDTYSIAPIKEGANYIAGDVVTVNAGNTDATITIDETWPLGGNTFVYNSNDSVWINDATLTVDYINKRVGVGTTNPVVGFHCDPKAKFRNEIIIDQKSNNAILGEGSNYDNLIGAANTAVGTNVMAAATTANNNSILGYNAFNAALSGSRNVAIGSGAIGLTTAIGEGNIAIGYQALQNGTGGNNIAIGQGAISNGTGGASNVSIGRNTLVNNTSSNNVAVGERALQNNTSGAFNTAVGAQSLNAVTSGIGRQNVGLGYQAGNNITTGQNNIVIGYQAQASSATVNNEITLGNSNHYKLRIVGIQQSASDGDLLTYNSTSDTLELSPLNLQATADLSTPSADNVGTLRYRTSGNNSYVDMCMQTGATTYEWVNIVQNNW